MFWKCKIAIWGCNTNVHHPRSTILVIIKISNKKIKNKKNLCQ